MSLRKPPTEPAVPPTPGRICTTLEMSKLPPGLLRISSLLRFCTDSGVTSVATRTERLSVISTSPSFVAAGASSKLRVPVLPEVTTMLKRVSGS